MVGIIKRHSVVLLIFYYNFFFGEGGVIRNVTFSFWSLHGLLTLYRSLVRPQLQYASVVWKHVTSSNSCKPERIQRKCVSLCHLSSFSQSPRLQLCFKLLKITHRKCPEALLTCSFFNESFQ